MATKKAAGKGAAHNATVVVTENPNPHIGPGPAMTDEEQQAAELERYEQLVAGQKADAIAAAQRGVDKAKQQLEWAKEALAKAKKENS